MELMNYNHKKKKSNLRKIKDLYELIFKRIYHKELIKPVD